MIDVYTDLMIVCQFIIMLKLISINDYFFVFISVILIIITYFHSQEMKRLKENIVK